MEPDTPYVELDGKVATRRGVGQYLMVGSKATDNKGRQVLRARGWIGADQNPKVIWRKVDNPPLYAGFTLRDMLIRHGIKVGGSVRLGRFPKVLNAFTLLFLADCLKSSMI